MPFQKGLMCEGFDRNEFIKRVRQEHETYQKYVKSAEDKKETALLHTNYFQKCLKDSMESMMQSKEARRIPIKIIVSILKDRKILSHTKADDAWKICDVRDWFTHRVNLKSIEEDTEELIRMMYTQFSINGLATYDKENANMVIHTNNKRKNFDLYERLDLVCSDLSTIVRKDTLHHCSMSKKNIES